MSKQATKQDLLRLAMVISHATGVTEALMVYMKDSTEENKLDFEKRQNNFVIIKKKFEEDMLKE